MRGAFLKIIDMNVRVYFQYRTSFLLSAVIFPMILLVNVMLFESIYAYSGSDEIKGYSLTQMIWYFAAVPIVYIFIWNGPGFRISTRILRGELTMDFLRPISVFMFELAVSIAGRLAAVTFEFVPTLVVYSLIYYPTFLTFYSFVKFVIVTILAFLIMFLINFLIGMTAFVLQNVRAADDLKSILIGLLGGASIPLDFMPDSVRSIIDVLPFKYIFYEPLQFFLNNPDYAGWTPLLHAVLIQLMWIAVLYLLTQVLWHACAKRFSAVGG